MQIDALWRYPVKSMGGERIDAATLGPDGFTGDRAFAIVDPEDGKVASAKNPRKWGRLLEFSARYPDGPQAPAVITFPGGEEVATDDPTLEDRLSAALGRPVSIARSAPAAPTYEADWPAIEGVAPAGFLDATRIGAGEEGGTLTAIPARPGTFFDLAGVHLVAGSTLAHLGTLAPSSVFDERRYRPNVVVGGAEGGFVENTWTEGEITLGAEVVLRPLIPTMRCVMTTLGQHDLPRDPGTLRAVSSANRIDIPGFGTWSCVGLYADVIAGGDIAVGDAFAVTAAN